MAQETKRFYDFGPFRFDPAERLLLRHGRPVPLAPKTTDTLLVLIQNAGHLVEKDDLIKRVWPDTFVEEGNLNKNISVLRKALGQWDGGLEYIETVPRRGYRFVFPPPEEQQSPPQQEEVAEAGASPVSIPAHRRLPKLAAAIIASGFTLALTFFLIWKIRPGNASRGMATSIRSLAVLPLENLSGDASQDYFADGMTDALITDLGQISALRVISRTSSMQYKGAHKSLPQIARELNVDAVVEGTVLRSGERMRVTAQLIHASTDRHLWAQEFEGDLRDILGLQNQIARAVADEIRVKLTPEQKSLLSGVRMLNPEAHEAYLRGFYAMPTIDGFQEKIRDFNRAIELDPTYAMAYVGVANSYIQLGHMVALRPQEAFPAAKVAALKAIALDDNLADAHEALGTVAFLYDWEFERAEKEFRRAIELNPNSADAHAGYSDFLAAMGRGDEAISQRKKNIENDPLSVEAIAELARVLYWTRHYDEAITEARKVLTIGPDLLRADVFLGLSLVQKGEFPEALVELEHSVSLWKDDSWIGFVAYAKAASGDKAGAYRILGDLERRSKKHYVSPWWLASIYSGVGNKEKALFFLERAYEGREHDLVFSKAWPMFDNLRQDARYRDLMKRVGLPD